MQVTRQEVMVFTVHDNPQLFKIKFRMTDYTEKEFDVDKKAF